MSVVGRVDESRTAVSEKDRRGVPPWIPLLLLGSGVVWSMVHAQAPVREPDAWWHLALGEQFRSGGSLSHPAALTPFATEPWVPTQWLFEVAASYLVDWVGVAALPWLVAVGAGLFGLALFVACRRLAGTLPATVATLAAFAAVSVFFVPRPQVTSFVLLAVFMGGWLETARDLRPRWWLVLLTYVWACAHGMWVVGPLVGLLVTAGLVLDRKVSRAQAARLLSIPVLGVLAAAATPVGPRLLLGPVNVSHVSNMIVEWQPPDFHEPDAALTAVLLFVVIVTWSRASAPAEWSHGLLLALAGAWTLYSARTLPLGAIIAAPLVAGAMSSWLRERNPRSGARRDILFVATFAALGIVLVTVVLRPHPVAFSMVGAPVDAELERIPADTVVFNEYAFGGWLDWNHRQVRPVIDGLTESYDGAYIAAHSASLRVSPGWQSVVQRTGATYALLYEDTPLASELRRRGWTARAEGQSPFGRGVILLESQAGHASR